MQKDLKYLIKTQLFEKFVAVRETVINYILRKQKEGTRIVLYIITQSGIMKMMPDELLFMCTSFSKESYESYQLGSYRLMWYNFVHNCEKITEFDVINEREVALLERFNYNWYNILRKYLVSDYMDRLNPVIQQERSMYQIYPAEHTKTLAIFKNTDPNNIKCVIVGQDPYPNNHANGIPFATNSSEFPVSLTQIISGIKKDFNIDGDVEFDGTLNNWIEQGIFPYNTALTVRERQPASHIEVWKEFTQKVMVALGTRPRKMVFILLGKEACKLKEYIGEQHLVLEVEHPAAASYQNREWNHNQCFIKAYEFLKFNSNIELKWIRYENI